MTIKTIRHCLWCSLEMECASAGKLICSKSCHGKMHRHRLKLGISNKEMIQQLKQQRLENETTA